MGNYKVGSGQGEESEFAFSFSTVGKESTGLRGSDRIGARVKMLWTIRYTITLVYE